MRGLSFFARATFPQPLRLRLMFDYVADFRNTRKVGCYGHRGKAVTTAPRQGSDNAATSGR